MNQKWLPNGSQMAPKWLPGGLWAALGFQSWFLNDFGVHFGAHVGSPNHQNWSRNLVEIRAPVWDAILVHLEASWCRFGVVFGLMLGTFFFPKPEKQIFWKTCCRLHGSMSFKGPRGQKSSRNRSKTWPKTASDAKCVLRGSRERFGSISGSILGPKSVPKADQKTSEILKRILRDFEAQGGRKINSKQHGGVRYYPFNNESDRIKFFD